MSTNFKVGDLVELHDLQEKQSLAGFGIEEPVNRYSEEDLKKYEGQWAFVVEASAPNKYINHCTEYVLFPVEGDTIPYRAWWESKHLRLVARIIMEDKKQLWMKQNYKTEDLC